jgi:uroporphyrinogen decarboxylase
MAKKQRGNGGRLSLNGFSETVSRRSFLATAGAAGLTVVTGGCARVSETPADRKDKILSVMNGETPQTYVPAMAFMHFDYSQFGGDALKTHLAYRDYVDMDVVKVQYEYPFTQENIPEKPSDWKNVKRLPPGFFDEPLALVKGCVDGARERGVPCIATLYSAFMCAGQGCGPERRDQHLVEAPDEVRKGLDIINEDVKLYVRECMKLGVDGFLASTQGGENHRPYPPETFREFIKPVDLDATAVLDGLPANILHVCDYEGPYDDYSPYVDYPGKIVNCGLLLKGAPITTKQAHEMLGGEKVFMGGLDRKGLLMQPDSEQAIIEEVKRVIAEGPVPMIVAPQCTVGNAQTVWDNVRTAVSAAHGYYA